MQSTIESATFRATPHDDAPKPNFWLAAAKFIALGTVFIALALVAALCLKYGVFFIASVAGVTGLVALPPLASIAKLAFLWMTASVLFAIAVFSNSFNITTVHHYNESKGLEMAVVRPSDTATGVAATASTLRQRSFFVSPEQTAATQEETAKSAVTPPL